jgi:hypothetical protein
LYFLHTLLRREDKETEPFAGKTKKRSQVSGSHH